MKKPKQKKPRLSDPEEGQMSLDMFRWKIGKPAMNNSRIQRGIVARNIKKAKDEPTGWERGDMQQGEDEDMDSQMQGVEGRERSDSPLSDDADDLEAMVPVHPTRSASREDRQTYEMLLETLEELENSQDQQPSLLEQTAQGSPDEHSLLRDIGALNLGIPQSRAPSTRKRPSENLLSSTRKRARMTADKGTAREEGEE